MLREGDERFTPTATSGSNRSPALPGAVIRNGGSRGGPDAIRVRSVAANWPSIPSPPNRSPMSLIRLKSEMRNASRKRERTKTRKERSENDQRSDRRSVAGQILTAGHRRQRLEDRGCPLIIAGTPFQCGSTGWRCRKFDRIHHVAENGRLVRPVADECRLAIAADLEITQHSGVGQYSVSDPTIRPTRRQGPFSTAWAKCPCLRGSLCRRRRRS